jgi:hypothetical protein
MCRDLSDQHQLQLCVHFIWLCHHYALSLCCLVFCRSQFADGGNSWSGGSNSAAGGKADLGLYSGCGNSAVECSVERLLWVPAYSPQQRQAASAAAAALTASAATLCTGSSLTLELAGADSSNAAGVADGNDSSPQTAWAGGRQQHQQHATHINAVASSNSLLSDVSLANMQQQQQQQQQQKQQHWQGRHLSGMQGSAAPGSSADSSAGVSPRDQMQAAGQQQAGVSADEGDSVAAEPDALLLLASGGDGGVLVWHVDRLTQVSQLCTLPGEVWRHTNRLFCDSAAEHGWGVHYMHGTS